LVKHIVLLKFKPEITERQIEEAIQRCGSLKELIPGITDFISGPYASPEGANQGFTHAFIVTFVDAASRDAYLPHPEHEVVRDLLLSRIESVVAFDFETP
jgi:Stress responsive A/B Barrel Domain